MCNKSRSAVSTYIQRDKIERVRETQFRNLILCVGGWGGGGCWLGANYTCSKPWFDWYLWSTWMVGIPLVWAPRIVIRRSGSSNRQSSASVMRSRHLRFIKIRLRIRYIYIYKGMGRSIGDAGQFAYIYMALGHSDWLSEYFELES